MRGCTQTIRPQGAVQWSLSGTGYSRTWSYGVFFIATCLMRGYTDTQGAAPWSLSGTARGSWVVSSAMYEGIYAEIQALRVLFNALGSSSVSYMVLLKSLAARIGSYGCLQCHMRGYTDIQVAA